jgi:hypothetical protein
MPQFVLKPGQIVGVTNPHVAHGHAVGVGLIACASITV